MVCRFLATATGIWKIAKANIPTNNGALRPKTSESGPKTRGPKAKPSTNKLVPSTMTSEETLNTNAVALVALLKMDDAMVTHTVISPSITVTIHFRTLDILRGFPCVILDMFNSATGRAMTYWVTWVTPLHQHRILIIVLRLLFLHIPICIAIRQRFI